MNFFKYIFPVIALLMVGGCSEDSIFGPTPDVIVEDDCIRLGVTLNVSAIKEASTRAFSDKPDYSKLKLYIFEFTYNGEDIPRSNELTEEYTDSISNYAVNADGDIHFNVTLKKYDTPRILHFIATEDTDLQITIMPTEGFMMPALQTSNGMPAYWQRIVFPNGYGEYNTEGTEFTPYETLLKEKLTHIPMIGNFAKVKMNCTAADFTYEGFALINQPRGGTVCPWNIDEGVFPEFLNGNTILDYDDIDATYKGYWPYNPQSQNFSNSSAASATFDENDKFMYERPNSSLYTPVVILKGRRSGSTESLYYKIDLGYKNENNLFEYYDILRNFEYSINVTQVGTDGYTTPQQAMNGVVYNNFSFDVNTRNMLNVSDGSDMLRVNQTTFVVTQDDQTEITLLYKYETIKGDGNKSNANVRFIVDPGTAIADVNTDITYGTTDNADGWRSVTIRTVNPEAVRKQASIIVYDSATGLGRTINIVVRVPWEYSDAGVWGGNYNFYDQFQNSKQRPEWEGYVSNSTDIGQPMTVRFHIEDDIPEAVFPLTFIFESNRQNIENNKTDGTMNVQFGSSYFYTGTGTAPRTIQYVKTVTWADYNQTLDRDNPTGTIIDDDNDGDTEHVIRARFQTILPITTGQTTTIRCYNPYIVVKNANGTTASQYLDVTFTGKEGEAPNYHDQVLDADGNEVENP